MKTRYGFLFAVAMIVAGCNVAQPETELTDKSAPEFYASFEDNGTRTYVDKDLHMFWTADDRLSIFTNTYNQQYSFAGNTGDNSGKFTKIQDSGFVTGNSLGANYAVYPYNENTSISYDGTISLSLPAVQKYADNTFGLNANTMVAATKDTDDNFLAFKNLCGYLVLKFYGNATIKSVTLTGNNGEKIAGKATVTAKNGQEPTVTMADDATASITIDCGEGVEIGTSADDATEFWFCVPPTTFSKGFAISLEDINGGTYNKSMTSSRSITRNVMNFMSALEYVMFEMVDLGLSVKWASCNLGAEKPEDYGGYYQWGGLQDVTSTNIDLGWNNCPFLTGSDYLTGWTKYIPYDNSSYWSGPGCPDDKTVLDPEDDIAHVKLGGRWRMPTDAEWRELMDNCTWIWTTQNGVNGYKVTSKKAGYTGNSIFLPYAGYREQTYLINILGSEYWSSSVYSDPSFAYSCQFGPSYRSMFSDYRYIGHSVRPVYGNVTGISLNKPSMTMTEGSTQTLTATITPSNASNKNIIWSSSDIFVATVNTSGEVTAVGAGTATITARTNDGGKTAFCQVTVFSSIPEYVDLGLSVKWATCNLGASKPDEYGGYYQWGGLQNLTCTLIHLDWSNCPYKTGPSSSTGWAKYIPSDMLSYWSGSGNPDNKTVLDPEDDIAHVKLGGRWRIPTDAEWTELRDNCTWTWMTQNGVNGYKVTSKVAGYTDNWIFLPAASHRIGHFVSDVIIEGDYWSSSLDTSNPGEAYTASFYSFSVFATENPRYYGQSVRPVLE